MEKQPSILEFFVMVLMFMLVVTVVLSLGALWVRYILSPILGWILG